MTLTDEQAMAQVIEAARQIVRVAELTGVTGGFMFEACNDQGRPPYRGHIEMSFAIPAGADPDGYFRQIAAAMVRHGWTGGPPPGMCPFGEVVHSQTVMAVICHASGNTARGSVQVSGECGNMTDHRHDGKTVGVDISDQLSGS